MSLPIRVHVLPYTRFWARGFSTEAPRVINHNKDVYGPPDPKSNLRLIDFYIPPDETPAEKEYRVKRAKLQEWNQEFWCAHNLQFTQAKEQFIISSLEKKVKDNSETTNTLTADELSEFYRTFLDINREKHLRYNLEWHKRNLSLLWPGIKASLSRIRKQIFT